MRLQAVLAILVLLALLPPASAQPSLVPSKLVPAYIDYLPGDYEYLEFQGYVGGFAFFAARKGDSYFLLAYDTRTRSLHTIQLPGGVRNIEGDSNYMVVHGKNYLAVYDLDSLGMLWRVDKSFESVDYSNGLVAAAKINAGTGVGQILVFNASTGSVVLNKTLRDLGIYIEAGISPEGYVAVASDRYVVIIAPDGHVSGNVSVENMGLIAPSMVSWSSDGSYVSVLYNLALIVLGKHGEKRLIEAAERQDVARWYIDQAWKPGDTLLAVAYRYGVKVYDASTVPAKPVMSVEATDSATEGVYFGGFHRLQWDPEGAGLLLAVLGPYDSPTIRLFNVSSGEEVQLSPQPEDLPAHPSWAGWLSKDMIAVYTGYYGMDRWVDIRWAAVYNSNGSLVSAAPLSNWYTAVAPLGDTYDEFAAYSPETGVVVYGWGLLTPVPPAEDNEFYHRINPPADAYAVAEKLHNDTFIVNSQWAVIQINESYAKVTIYKFEGDTPNEAYEGLLLILNITFKSSSNSGGALMQVDVEGDKAIDYVYYATVPGEATVKYANGDNGKVRLIITLPSAAPGAQYTVFALIGHRPPSWLPPAGNATVHVELKPLGGGETQTTTTSIPKHTTTTTSTITIKTKTKIETPTTPIHTLETATGTPAAPPGEAGFAGGKEGGKQNTTLIAAGAIIVVIIVAAAILARR